MKKIFAILLSLVLSLVIVFILPDFLSETQAIDIAHTNEKSKVNQNVVGYSDTETTYYKLYFNGELIGVINDLDYFNDLLNSELNDFKKDFPDSIIGLNNDCYIVNETSNIIFENIDDEIASYARKNSLLGINATAVEFSTNQGVYEIIYIKSEEDFNAARNNFLLNFISKESLDKISNNDTISSPVDFGSVDTNLSIEEKITFSEAIVNPEDIMTSQSQIYEFLCYGRNEERQYYETKVGDTVQAVGYHFGDMSAKQIMMLNPDVIFNEDQILAPGTKLNVTYYESPLTVVVTKQRLSQESVLPDAPIYIEDESLKQGSRKITVEEENGLRNVLYEEKWINGVIQEGQQLSYNTIKEPVQGVIAVGTMVLPDVGTGNWGWPVDNPIITCNYTCYANHGGTDFQNRYARWDSVLACDSGVVEGVGYTDVGGYYVRINHNNGFTTYYGHMRTYPYVSVGEVVERGDILGPIGMTGLATGPHVHFAMYYQSKLIDPCSVLACYLLY